MANQDNKRPANQGRNSQPEPPPAVSKRYNVLFPREYMDSKGEKRTDFIRVGVAFELKNQDGFTVELYMNPPSRKLVVMPVREKENTQGDAFEDYGGFGGPYEP